MNLIKMWRNKFESIIEDVEKEIRKCAHDVEKEIRECTHEVEKKVTSVITKWRKKFGHGITKWKQKAEICISLTGEWTLSRLALMIPLKKTVMKCTHG